MATESPIRIFEGTDRWPNLKQSTRYGPPSSKIATDSLGLFLKDQRFQSLEKDVIPSRSGSAPPNMEGSIAAIENILSHRKSALYPGSIHSRISVTNRETELQFRADPSSSSSYHNTDANLDKMSGGPHSSFGNSLTFQLGVGSGSSNTTHAKCGDGSLSVEESEDDRSSEQSGSVSVEKAALLGYHSRSLDSVQGDTHHISSPSYDQYRSLNYKAIEETVVTDVASQMHNMSVSISSADTNTLSLDDKSHISPLDQERDFIDVKVETEDNLSTTGAVDVNSAHIEAVKGVNVFSALNSDMHNFHKKEHLIPQNSVPQLHVAPQDRITSGVQGSYSQIIYPGMNHAYGSSNQFHYDPTSVSTTEVQPLFQSSGFTPPQYATSASFMTSHVPFYPNLLPAGFFNPHYSMGGYNFNAAVLPSYLPGYPHQGVVPMAFNGGSVHAYDPQNLMKFYGRFGVPLQPPVHMPYFQPPVRGSYGSYSYFDHQKPGDGTNQVGYCESRKGAELVGLSNDCRPPYLASTSYDNLNLKRGNAPSHYYLRSPTNDGPLVHFPAVVSPVVQSKPASETNFPGGRYNMGLSHSSSGNPVKTSGQSQNWNNMNSHSFLEELKSGKSQRFELSDIAGYIVEFSVDQHGSRFIQQKLETCTVEEKASVFKEVVPHASKLMTDVFGNYVVQKLFEYGSPEQRKYLASQLEGQILPLSFQMYGCRVIQKALEVIDLEQKARLVRELDGHIMRCVRDQNGNHVIQKCIESIPTDRIQFILSSFHGQVATLSMHPYGCRVIQRILEHCNDDNIQTQFIVDEILDSVCMLAQDQYGNYVTQHVLERGKPLERSVIIENLAGSIVQLSQHKFASNVVEKCLEYSDSTTRGMLIKEIIGHGEKNDNLLIMMKDQYANYVIQKILEKCSTDQREVLLGLIRNHLTALKKYTYGKHIVARFEQLYGEDLGCDCSSPKIKQAEIQTSGW